MVYFWSKLAFKLSETQPNLKGVFPVSGFKKKEKSFKVMLMGWGWAQAAPEDLNKL